MISNARATLALAAGALPGPVTMLAERVVTPTYRIDRARFKGDGPF